MPLWLCVLGDAEAVVFIGLKLESRIFGNMIVILLYIIHLNLETAVGAVLSGFLDIWYSCFVYGFQVDLNFRSTHYRILLAIMTIEMRLLLEPYAKW